MRPSPSRLITVIFRIKRDDIHFVVRREARRDDKTRARMHAIIILFMRRDARVAEEERRDGYVPLRVARVAIIQTTEYVPRSKARIRRNGNLIAERDSGRYSRSGSDYYAPARERAATTWQSKSLLFSFAFETISFSRSARQCRDGVTCISVQTIERRAIVCHAPRTAR